MVVSQSLRMLIVEDDVVDRKLLERLLAQSSLGACDVCHADRLAQALDLLAHQPFDVVLLDLGLPDSQGMDSVACLQAHAPQVPIIVLSGLDDEDMATQAVQMGVQDYLIKGQVNANLLMRSIRYALERKKAERQLQAAELRYRTIFENSAVAIMMVDEQERLVSWNKFTEHLLHLREEELRGRDVRTFYPGQEWQKIRALSIRRKGMQHHLETRMICGDGAVIDVDISLSVVRDSDGDITGSIGVIRDITERKRMEEALRQSERRFRQVAENAREWIWEVDANGVYTYASPVVEKILGYKVEEVVGKKRFYEFLHPEDADRLQCEAQTILNRKDVFKEFQTRNLDREGKVVWLLRSGVPVLDENGALLGYRGADVDITERQNAEEALRRHVCEIERFNRLATARELRVVELKQRVNELAVAAGQTPPYLALQEEAASEFEADSTSTDAAVPDATVGSCREHAVADLLDRERMRQLMESYCDAVGVASAVIDTEGNVLLEAGWQRVCREFHRADPRTRARCVESDTILAGQMRQGQEFSLYECRNGLTDAAAPVIIEGRHVANVFIGQFFLEPVDETIFRRQAGEFGFDETDYLAAIRRVPIIAREKLPAMLKYMTTCAQLLAEIGLERTQGESHEADLLRWAEELNQANQALRRQREAALSLAEDANEAREIAERVREALLLKDSAVNSAASGIVFFDLEGKLTFANPSALRMWGYDEERQVLGRSIEAFVMSADQGAGVLRTARENGVWSGDLVACRRDGSDFIVQVSASIVQDKSARPLCLMVSLVDVTESRRIHEILDHKQKNLEAIFDATPLGMLLVSDRLQVTRANDVIRQMSGKGYAHLIGHDICETLNCTHAAPVVDGTEEGRFCEACPLRSVVQKALASHESIRRVEMQLAPHDDVNARPWLAVSAEPVNIDGRNHVLIALNDVTDSKRAEEELQKTLEMKAQFISTVSHELRTPLTSMREAIVIVRDGVAGRVNKDQANFLEIAKRNTDRLSRLIDDVLDFQKLNSGKMKFHMQENRIAVTVDDVFSTMRPHAGAAGVNLSMDLQPELPQAVYDSDRITQALINLVSNAIKFTPQGGQVQVTARLRQDHLAIGVSDTGYGIPKEELPKVFDQFYRVHRPGKEIKGTGLGLAIVNRIVVAHGGRIEVESELGKGTTFTVLLPLAPQNMPAGDTDRADRSAKSVLIGK